MNILQTIEAEEKARLVAQRAIPDFQPGDTLRVMVKIKEGVTFETAQSDMTAIGNRNAELYPETNTGHIPTLQALREALVGTAAPAVSATSARIVVSSIRSHDAKRRVDGVTVASAQRLRADVRLIGEPRQQRCDLGLDDLE